MRVDTEERIVRCANEGLLSGGLSKFVIWRHVVGRNIVMDFLLLDDFSAFNVHLYNKWGSVVFIKIIFVS
jgi:hypothetical protein